ncbi:MAG: DUF4446 family protein [Patescibacteria group bacterium]
MNSIFENPLAVAVIILFVLVVVLIIWVTMLHTKLKKFLVNVDSDTITDSLASVSSDLKNLHSFRAELETYLSGVEKRLRKSIQSVHTIRFNPFKGTGGGSNQSFATTLINEEGDGVILSSLYSRDHVSVFAKPLKRHVTEHELSDEEVESLENAKTGLGK